jgi:hypothetical protein
MEDRTMSFWTFTLLVFILGVFTIAQVVKLLNSESKAGELSRELALSVINRIRRGKDASEKEEESTAEQ